MAEGSGETSPLASVIGFSILPLQKFRGALAERSGRQKLVTILYAAGMVLFLRGVSTDGLASLLLPLFGLVIAESSSFVIAFVGKIVSLQTRAFGVPHAQFALLPRPRRPAARCGTCPNRIGSAAASLQAVAVLTLSIVGLLVYAANKREMAG